MTDLPKEGGTSDMAVTYTTIDTNGAVHSRSTFYKQAACPAPDWVSRIGSSGGEHNIGTCPRCWLEAIVKSARVADGTRQAWDDENERLWALERALAPPPVSLGKRELDYLNGKQAERIRRVAECAPVRRLPSVLKELRSLASVAAAQLSRVGAEQTRLTLLRYYVIQQAASVAWERLKLVCEDRSLAYRLRRYVPPENPYT